MSDVSRGPAQMKTLYDYASTMITYLIASYIDSYLLIIVLFEILATLGT